MSKTRIIQYLHRPNSTELGMGNTHETYMLVGANQDMSLVFPPSIEIEVEDSNSHKKYRLKSSNPSEFRINQLGPIYRDYKVKPGDEIAFTYIKKQGMEKTLFTVFNKKRVIINTSKQGSEIVNADCLSEYSTGDKTYSLLIYNRGQYSTVQIAFSESKKKRRDSPDTTDFYNVEIDGIPLNNGTHYLTIDTQSTLLDLPKSEFNIIDFDENDLNDKTPMPIDPSLPVQQITYGAPGTGKSHEIKERTAGYSVIRTTFHPDSDYSTFVGAYKPTMGKGKVYGAQGPLQFEGRDIEEDRITYTFVKQAFLKAYLSAWKKYAAASDTVDPQFLIIEEINRGNCAQIFGDLFQLLDRSDNKFSTYPIEADSDLQKEIKRAFIEDEDYKLTSNIQIEGVVEDYTSNYGKSLSEDVQEGRVLLLPPNLYIWATMNTSDQSLFPIDSAFKRRWEWNYVKISNAYKKLPTGEYEKDAEGKLVPLGWYISADDVKPDWWKFLNAINEKIALATSSDDKKLGYFFCKPPKNEQKIDSKTFVSKVIFYLWNDVFKDNDVSLFNVEDNAEPSFDVFYTQNAQGKVVPNEKAIKKFLVNVMGELKSTIEQSE